MIKTAADSGHSARPLLVVTYNIHKGFSQFNRKMVIHELRERLRSLAPDIVFLQEVQGLHTRHARRHHDWPPVPQHEFLAGEIWDSAYGSNALYDHGHHGNAILSRFPIISSHNQDVTHWQFERRGLLHCRLRFEENMPEVHCVCVHLSLLGGSRKRQMIALRHYLEHAAPANAPLIIAGDFNDWRNRADDELTQHLGLTEVFGNNHRQGKPVRSFPAALPLLRLDRIYVRGFAVRHSEVHFGRPWSKISDHAPLSARLQAQFPMATPPAG